MTLHDNGHPIQDQRYTALLSDTQIQSNSFILDTHEHTIKSGENLIDTKDFEPAIDTTIKQFYQK